MIGTTTYKKWKYERTLPDDAPAIPDHAHGYHPATMIDFWGPHEQKEAHGFLWVWRTFPGKTFYPELIERYYSVLTTDGGDIKPKDDYQRCDHLIELLITLDKDTTMSLTKKHRWLGYIQGVLSANGLLSVGEERDFTRRIFNGA